MQNMNFTDLITHLENSKGATAENRLKELLLMHYIFSSNFNSLMQYIEHTKDEKNAIEIIRTGNQQYFEAFTNELTRHFFNFIVSTKAYIDQTRRWIKNYYLETEIETRYNELKKQYFENNRLCKFIQDLRNYQEHYMIPFTAYNATFSTRQPFKFKITIPKEKLLQYKEWKNQSLQYINSFEKDLLVETFCNDYFQLIEEFYSQLLEKVKQFHTKDFKELELIKDELKKRYPMKLY